jgi:hypothetical protein
LADAADDDPRAPPAEIARQEALKEKLDAACARFEAEATAERSAYESKKAAYQAKTGRRGRPPKPPEETPPADLQTNPGPRRGRLYDLRQPPEPKPQRRITEPWRLAMKVKLESEDGKARCKKRKQTVEPVFGVVKSAIGFARFRFRGRQKVAAERPLIALACNCRRLHNLRLV